MRLQVEVDGWQVDVEVTCYIPAVAGHYSGRPEDCYPDEPEWVEFEVEGYEELCAPEDHCTSEELLDLDELEDAVLEAIHNQDD